MYYTELLAKIIVWGLGGMVAIFGLIVLCMVIQGICSAAKPLTPEEEARLERFCNGEFDRFLRK